VSDPLHTPASDARDYLQTQFGENRCTQFRVILVTDPPTHTNKQTHTHTHPQTHPQTGPITIHCAAASAQCKYINYYCINVPTDVYFSYT